MRKLILLTVFAACATLTAFSQTQYEISRDPKNGEKTLKGLISRDLLTQDTAFKWYAENLTGYKANAAALEGFKKHKDSVQVLVFMGTWCEDSHSVIPKFFTLMDEAQVPLNHITLFGVNRQKESVGQLSAALGITNVPTIIILKNGKELGRVVEYGKFGLFDMDLGEILKGIQ